MSLDVHLNPKPCPHCGRCDEPFWQSITHNLVPMAKAAGIYGIVWHPAENGIKTAGQLIEPLRIAIKAMHDDPERFKVFDAPNGWGLYENFLPWLEKYLEACEQMPDAAVEANR